MPLLTGAGHVFAILAINIRLLRSQDFSAHFTPEHVSPESFRGWGLRFVFLRSLCSFATI
jgi:hypothetical protein